MSFSSSRTKVFSTNETNTIETSTDNLILSDSDYREVVKQGYLLNNISLSSVPDIIQDAIDQAKIDAKDITLADDLLISLRYEVDNLNSGVYTKTYVDQQITYLSEAIVQRVDSETLASVVDSKIAIATEDLVATSAVDILSGRIGDSESSISSLAETVNTNDLARASQITNAIAQVDDSLAAYSEAIDLTVDEFGNATSSKIETLQIDVNQNVVDITETNDLVATKDLEWKASSMKLITNPYGGITGYSFQDGSGLVSNFTINADTFRISDSINSYTPFSIIGNNLSFNGIVTFSNITGGENIVTTDTVQTAINDNVTTIDGGKIATSEAFVNNLNAQGGIIADNVTANDFYGKNFYGGYFEGALIVGAVLKASYLDLDGELEVLTNYHIPVATYNSNPSLYTDAIYTETANEYRIPSLSTVYETVKNQSISSGSWMDGLIKAYDVANAGHNNKAVKIRPFIIIAANTTIISGSLTMQGSGGYSPTSTLSGTTSFSIYFGGSSFVFSFNHATGGHYAWGDDSNIWGGVTTPTFIGNGTTGNASYSYNIPNDYSPPTVSASGSKTFSALGLSFTMYYSVVGYALSYSLRVNTGTTFATSDLVSASMFRIKCNSIGSGSGSRYAKASSSIQVNNMA